EEHGVHFRLGTTITTVEDDRVILATGESIPADFIVAGVGVRPNTQLAQSAGLTIDNGVIVDEFLQTSVDGIYAAGDIAHYRDRPRSRVAADREGDGGWGPKRDRGGDRRNLNLCHSASISNIESPSPPQGRRCRRRMRGVSPSR